jgi:putative oxidoreductase
MDPVRRIARPLLASIFLAGGADALRAPRPKVPVVDDVAPEIAQHIPGLENKDTETLIRINGGVQVGAGVLLVLNRFPRLAALAAALTLIPTTAAAHRFWELKDPGDRSAQQVQFFKNLSLFGGLLIAFMDTEGRPGIGWRTRNAASRATKSVRRGTRDAKRAGKTVRREAKLAGKSAKRETKLAGKAARGKLPA